MNGRAMTVLIMFAAAIVAAEEPVELQAAFTIAGEARRQTDFALSDRLLSEAEQLLVEFAKARPDSDHIVKARYSSGKILVERARLRMQDAATTDDPAAFRVEARGFFEQADRVFAKAQDAFFEKFRAIPITLDAKAITSTSEPVKVGGFQPPPDAVSKEQRDQWRADYLQTKLLIALTKEEAADTFPANAPERTRLLENAADRFAEIYYQHSARVIGLHARLYQTRALQKLGRHRPVTVFVDDLLSLPDDSPAVRNFKVRAVTLGIPSWKARGELADAVRNGLELLNATPEAEKYSLQNQELRYHVAQAIADRCDELTKQAPPDDRELRSLKLEGKRLIDEIRKSPNDWREFTGKITPRFAARSPVTRETP